MSLKLLIKALFVVLFLFAQSFLFSNNPEIDSLEQQLLTLQGYERYDVLIRLTKSEQFRQPGLSLEYAKEAQTLAEEAGNNQESYIALKYIGMSYIVMGNSEKAIGILSELLEIYSELGEETEAGKINNLLGIAYVNLDQHNLALDHFLKSLVVNEKNKNKAGITKNYNNLGIVYYELGNFEKALEYFKNTLRLYEEKQADGSLFGSDAEISLPVGNISMIYKEMQIYDTALMYAKKALDLNLKSGNDYGVAGTMNNIGYIYDGMQEYSSAIEAYKQSLEINKKVNDKWSIANTNINIANSYINSGNYDKALPYLDQALLIAKDINAKDLMIFAYETYSSLYKQKELYKKSLDYYLIMTELKDSVFTEEKNRQITEMQIKYETEKKENENLALIKDNEIQQLKISRKNIFIYSLSAGVAIILFLLILNFIQFQRRLRSYKQLAEKNLEIVHFEKEIKQKPKVDSGNGQTTELVQKLIDYMENEKPYLLSDVNFTDICKHMNTNRSYLSGAINNHYRINFTQLINRYRIKDARILLSDTKYDHISVEGIGEMVGFVSRSVFYKNFKTLTGITPSFFRDSINN
ncbi:MAG: tetratricopeptide repeat protein [Bacteroidales bacterium]|nr:tetratricopeptide repeat protein [Bacteroidales bacterium]